MSEPIIEALRRFETFRALSDDDLTVLAGRAEMRSLPQRSVLFRHGDDDAWIHCLTEGALELVAGDGRRRRIEAGTRAAGHPVGHLRPRQYTATAVTPVNVISIDGSALGNWHEVPMSCAFEVQELDAGGGVVVCEGADGEAAPDHVERLSATDAELPSLPTIALEARRIIDRDETGVDMLARLVLNDPPIAAKLIKAANSPVFYGRGSIETCERAIVRLGLKTTRQLVVAFAMRDLFRCNSPQIQARMEALWEHSAEVAAISYVIARKLAHCDPDEAQLAGLVHDIGGVPVLSYAVSHTELTTDEQALAALDARMRPSIGPRLLRSWNFPEAIVAAAREAEDWWRVGGASPELADVVVVAHLVSFYGRLESLELPPLAKVPAFQKVFGDGAGPQQITELLDEAQQQIDDLRGLLSS